MLPNDRQICKKQNWKPGALIFVLMFIVSFLVLPAGRPTLAQSGNWTPPTVISTVPDESLPVFAWFPDIAIDEFGLPHITWCQTIPLEDGSLKEQVSYTRWDGTDWAIPNDIVPPSADIARNAIATDMSGNIHLLFGGSAYGTLALYHQRAPLEQARSAGAWSLPHRINQGISYMGDLAADSHGTLYVIYDDSIFYDDTGAANADIFYRRSANGGRTWSRPINLYLSPETGSSRPQIEIDANDVIHVTWDEGWDRLSGTGEAHHSFYTSSPDGGQTWVQPTAINYPDSTIAQLTVGSDGHGGVMLVWRAASRSQIYYQWSTDGGYSWGAPATIPQIFARPWGTNFDMYDMTTDSSGGLHLIVVARETKDDNTPLGVYYLQWDGITWLAPERIFAAHELAPEYPKIITGQGNQLHATWFTRQGSEFDDFATRQVWYSSGQTGSPYAPVTPRPTATVPVPTPTPSPKPKATPFPTLGPEHTGLPDNLKTESDDLFRLAVALSPLILIVLVVIILKTGWSKRLRR